MLLLLVLVLIVKKRWLAMYKRNLSDFINAGEYRREIPANFDFYEPEKDNKLAKNKITEIQENLNKALSNILPKMKCIKISYKICLFLTCYWAYLLLKGQL